MTDTVYTIRELNLESCTYTKPEKFKGFAESFVVMNGSRVLLFKLQN